MSRKKRAPTTMPPDLSKVIPQQESAEHHTRCPICGHMVDELDLDEVLQHLDLDHRGANRAITGRATAGRLPTRESRIEHMCADKGATMRVLRKGEPPMQNSESDRSAYAASVKRRISDMREKLGMGPAPDTANENSTIKEKRPTEPKGR